MRAARQVHEAGTGSHACERVGAEEVARRCGQRQQVDDDLCLRQQRNTFYDALLYKKHPRLYRERIRPVPPWDYYAIVALTATAGVAGLGAVASPTAAARPGLAVLCAGASLALVLRFFWRRLRDTDRSLRNAAEMLLTSAAIPFLSVWWRLRGALHFRVLFL